VAIQQDVGASRHLYVLADRQRLSQILLNLLSNAVKYNRPEGKVVITCRELPDGRAQIRVRDTGRGIPHDRLSRLFRPFDRLGAEDTGVEGTGLGLTVARELARAMGGSLDLETQIGEGSTFWVELPTTSAPAVSAPAREVGRGDPRQTRRDVSGRVLYVDDNRSNARLLERVLARRPGVRLSAATLGADGLAAARRERPDLILLDLHLPDMHGEQVLRTLKNDDRTRNIPVAILSADATTGGEQRLIEAGAIAYLTKPLEIARLLRLVDEALPRAAATQPDIT
jgi:CheY-like chemotaxis protein